MHLVHSRPRRLMAHDVRVGKGKRRDVRGRNRFLSLRPLQEEVAAPFQEGTDGGYDRRGLLKAVLFPLESFAECPGLVSAGGRLHATMKTLCFVWARRRGIPHGTAAPLQ